MIASTYALLSGELDITSVKMQSGLWSSSSGTVPAQQVWGPEFKLQNCQNKNKIYILEVWLKQ
jgi:hypothetical protein